jgi:hypothetical protein
MAALIQATDYNTLQSKVALIFGPGSSDYGYGQVVSSAPVVQAVSITSPQWVNLRNDLLRARQHQTGTDLSTLIQYPDVGVLITQADFNAATLMADAMVTNRLIRPPDNQVTVANLITPQVRTSPWNGQLNQIVTVNFASANDARYFFNTGSALQFSASITGYTGSGSAKGPTWDAMLTGMGTIIFGQSTTTCSGSGTGSAIGFAQVTSSYQQIFNKPAPSGTYADNDYFIYVKANSATQLEFRISFQDNATFTNTTIYPGGYGPYGVDEDVNGTLTSNVQMRYATGPNVAVAAPSGSSTGI